MSELGPWRKKSQMVAAAETVAQGSVEGGHSRVNNSLIYTRQVNELRHELECRNLNSKGLKSQLIARLTKTLKAEAENEESVAEAEKEAQEEAAAVAAEAEEEAEEDEEKTKEVIYNCNL